MLDTQALESRERARRVTRLPAVALLVVAGASLLLVLLALAGQIANPTKLSPDAGVDDSARLGHWIGMGTCIALFCASFVSLPLALAGAISMLVLRARWLAIAGALAACVPASCCFPLTTPIGIWALVALSDADVKAAFAGEAPSSFD